MNLSLILLEIEKRHSLLLSRIPMKLIEDYDKRNVFDIEEYIKRKGKPKMNGNTVITRL